MARLPDQFDLWVRKARGCPDPARQVDYILGALVGLKEWHCLNIGSKEEPLAAQSEVDGKRCLVVFTDEGRVSEILEEAGHGRGPDGVPIISIPAEAAMIWCLEQTAGLLVNPGDDAVSIPVDQLEAFYTEWSKRGGRQAAGFWIPNMTTEEEDFWQEHGV